MVRSYAARVPKLQASESLAARLQIASGTGSFASPDAAQAILDGWHRLASPDQSTAPTNAELRGMGIGVRHVPR